MPLHHASRLEWQNTAPYADVMGRGAGERLIFTVTIVDRRIQLPPPDRGPGRGGQPFRATYQARIESICGAR